MSLTGDALPILLGIVAVALFAGIVIGPRAVGSQWRVRLVRAVQAIGLNILVLAVCALLLNNTFDFYMSWSDLLGVHNKVVTAQSGTAPSKAVAVRLPSPDAVRGPGTGNAPLPPLPEPGRRLQRVEVTGAASHLVGEVLVELPRGYDPASRTHHPVLLALHGTPGEPQAWLGPMGFGAAIDAAVDDHQLTAPIIVMPQVNFPYTRDSECVDGPTGTPQVETWLAQDLPAWIVTHLRVQGARTGWAVTGYSAGGWCAALLGMHHPDTFGGVLVLGGYFAPEFSPGFAPLSAAAVDSPAYDLVSAAAHRPPAIAMWVMSSKGDAVSYPSTVAFLRAAHSPLSVTSWVMRTGGHRFSLWRQALPHGLQWLGRTLPGFAVA